MRYVPNVGRHVPHRIPVGQDVGERRVDPLRELRAQPEGSLMPARAFTVLVDGAVAVLVVAPDPAGGRLVRKTVVGAVLGEEPDDQRDLPPRLRERGEPPVPEGRALPVLGARPGIGEGTGKQLADSPLRHLHGLLGMRGALRHRADRDSRVGGPHGGFRAECDRKSREQQKPGRAPREYLPTPERHARPR